MEKVILKATKRDVVGKQVKALRREGKLPAVIYGRHTDPISINLDAHSASLALGRLTSAEAVEKAMDEFDELGQEAFLEKYGYGPAKRYFVERDGTLYDSKALCGVAMGYQFPEQCFVRTSEFSGGEGFVLPQFREHEATRGRGRYVSRSMGSRAMRGGSPGRPILPVGHVP